MSNEHLLSLHDQREVNKISLETYHMDWELDFDYSIDKLMQQLIRENEKSRSKHEAWINIEKHNPEKYALMKEETEKTHIPLELQLYELMESIMFNDDQLTALVEMKIIYAYKLFEIRLKKLLRASLSAKTDSFYRWHVMSNFLNEKGINVRDIEGHDNVIQLQDVNNALKHTDEMTSKLKSIPEFRLQKKLGYEELEYFYKRVRSAPKLFIENLAYAIYKELYLFDERKLVEYVNALVLRMDKDIAHKFAKQLMGRYK